jgi:hypothetical protein
MRQLFNNLYAPESDSGGGTTTADENLDTFELLNEETSDEVLDLSKTPEKTKEEGEEEGEVETEEEEVDELKEIEEELKGPSEEDLELMTPVRRKEILAKYPKLFKDFPYLEKAYYREQQFTEVFPTINDAKLAVEKAGVMDNIERQVMSGDITTILQAAKSENNEAFLKIADNYLPTLRKVDQQAYYHVLGGVVKDTIVTMVREARSLGEQGAPLQAAANILNQFVFGSQNFQPHQPLSKQSRPEEQNREQEFQQQDRQRVMTQFESTREDLQTRADNVLKSTIDQHIDPNKTMTDYVRNHATKEAFEKLEDLISKDTRFRGLLDKLWERAFSSNFNKSDTDKIKSAYLSKAKTLLPSVIKKARNDALRGLGRRASSDSDTEETSTPKKSPITPGRSTTQSSSGKIKSGKDIPRGMSTLDFLNS